MENKPWLKNKNTNEIEIMGAKIQLRKLSFGQSRQAIKEASKINIVTKQVDVDPILLGVLRALYSIESWDLTDENDNPIPITMDTFDNVLSEEFVSEIIEKVNAQEDILTEAEKKQ